MQNVTKTLFGGALMAAGMTAHAQTFIYQDSSSDNAYSSIAYSYAYGGAYDFAARPAALNTFSSGFLPVTGTTTMSTSQTSTSMGVSASWAGDGSYGFGGGNANLVQFFEVSADGSINVSWDVSGTDGWGFAFIDVYNGANLFLWDGIGGDPLTGSVDVPVTAGTEYGIRIYVFPYIYDANSTKSVVATIPSAGSVAVLGLAGLTATRRRR